MMERTLRNGSHQGSIPSKTVVFLEPVVLNQVSVDQRFSPKRPSTDLYGDPPRPGMVLPVHGRQQAEKGMSGPKEGIHAAEFRQTVAI